MSVLLNILTAIRLKKDEVIGKMYWNSKGIDKMLALAAYLSGFVIIEKEISSLPFLKIESYLSSFNVIVLLFRVVTRFQVIHKMTTGSIMSVMFINGIICCHF